MNEAEEDGALAGRRYGYPITNLNLQSWNRRRVSEIGDGSGWCGSGLKCLFTARGVARNYGCAANDNGHHRPVGVVPGLRITRTALRFSCTQVMPRWMRTGHDAAGQYPPGRSAICLVGSSLIHCDDLESVAIASVSLRTATGCWDHCVPHPRILLVLRFFAAHHSCATLLCRPCWSCGMLLPLDHPSL